jgi:hypothetical protein
VLQGRYQGLSLFDAAFDLTWLTCLSSENGHLPGTLRSPVQITAVTRLREAGMALEAVQAQAGHRSIESSRVYLHLANDWLADQYLRAGELIDADTAAVAEMLAVQEVAAR